MDGAWSPSYGSSATSSTLYIISLGRATTIGTVATYDRAAQSCSSTWMSVLYNAAADCASKASSGSSSRAVVGPTISSLSITPGSSELISGNGAYSPRRP